MPFSAQLDDPHRGRGRPELPSASSSPGLIWPSSPQTGCAARAPPGGPESSARGCAGAVLSRSGRRRVGERSHRPPRRRRGPSAVVARQRVMPLPSSEGPLRCRRRGRRPRPTPVPGWRARARGRSRGRPSGRASTASAIRGRPSGWSSGGVRSLPPAEPDRGPAHLGVGGPRRRRRGGGDRSAHVVEGREEDAAVRAPTGVCDEARRGWQGRRAGRRHRAHVTGTSGRTSTRPRQPSCWTVQSELAVGVDGGPTHAVSVHRNRPAGWSGAEHSASVRAGSTA